MDTITEDALWYGDKWWHELHDWDKNSKKNPSRGANEIKFWINGYRHAGGSEDIFECVQNIEKKNGEIGRQCAVFTSFSA